MTKPTVTTKRCRKSTKAERELIYAEPESNAGAGWTPMYRDTRERYPEYVPVNPKPVDKEMV